MFVTGNCLGWKSRPAWHDFGSELLTSGLLCAPVLLGMLFVRAVFQHRAVRVLYDVLALLMWLLLLVANWGQCTPDAAPAGGEALLMIGVLAFGSVAIASGAALVLAWRKPKRSGGP